MEGPEVILFVILTTASLLFLIAGIIYFILQYRNRRIKYDAEKKIVEEQHRIDLLKTQVDSQEQSMKFIGQEIHDSVTQKITLASLYLKMTTPDTENERKENVQQILQNVLDELRQLSHALMDDQILQMSLAELIRREIQLISHGGILEVKLDLDDEIAVDARSKNALIRVVQEFAQNTLKHARASQLKIILRRGTHCLWLTLEDDGIGFQVEDMKSKGMGLSNITRRIAAIAGKSSYLPNLVSGTRLEIEVPIL